LVSLSKQGVKSIMGASSSGRGWLKLGSMGVIRGSASKALSTQPDNNKARPVARFIAATKI
jgi:hypothetical protein